MFGMHSVLAEFQRVLNVANTPTGWLPLRSSHCSYLPKNGGTCRFHGSTPLDSDTGRPADGAVKVVEKYSSTAIVVHFATGNCRAVQIQAAASVAVISSQTANRSAISVRHSAAVSRCRRGLKCGDAAERG